MGELRLDGRVAIVTGGGRGMGAEHARALAERGASVVVNDVGTGRFGMGESDTGVAAQVVSEIVANGGAAVANVESVATTDGAASIVQLALDTFGRVDIVVNNAGISSQQHFPDIDFEEFKRHFDVHLAGAFNVTRAAWPHMVREGYGRVILITSSAFFGLPQRASYPAAKAGQLGLMKSLALTGYEAGVDIKVNAIAPIALTRMGPMNMTTLPEAGEVPLEARLVSAAVVWLAHEECPVNGEIFGVGGGKIDRVFFSATRGYVNPSLTPEDIAEHWPEVMDVTESWIPANAKEHADGLRHAAAAMLGGESLL